MSHTTKIAGIAIRSIPALRAAVTYLQGQGVGCSLEEKAKPRAYYSTQEGMEEADFVLTLKGSRYDVGFYKQADGSLEARTDFWGQDVEKVLGVPVQPAYAGEQFRMGKLFQAYAMTAAEEQARRQGYMVTRQVQSDGRIKLQINGFQ